MLDTTKLTPFKTLFKNSWTFYKAHYKEFILLFVPLEIITLASLLLLDIIPVSDYVVFIILTALLNVIVFVSNSYSKLMVFDAPRVVGEVMVGGTIPRPIPWYRSMIKKIIPLSIALFVVGAANITFVAIVVGSAGIIFTLLAYLFSGLPANSWPAVILGIAVAVCLLYAAIRYIARFFIAGIFTSYMYIFEDKRGLDALTASFLITKNRRGALLLRFVAIWIITAIPFFLLVFPITASIGIANIAELYGQYISGVNPDTTMISAPSVYVSIMRDIFTSLATLISVSFFVVINYFLWKDVKATAVPFEERVYVKTRKMLRNLIGAGIVFFAILFVISLVADAINLAR